MSSQKEFFYAMETKKKLVILSNIGTPRSPEVPDVKTYLTEFLMDEDVITLPWVFRTILVRGIIVPFRSYKSAAKYKSIWMPEGSPLMVYSERMRAKLQTHLGDQFEVRIGMRYAHPNIAEACLGADQFDQVYFWPLFPQFAEATSGSVEKEVRKHVPNVQIQDEFYKDEFFLHALESLLKSQLSEIGGYDHLLFSYHGLPVAQVGNYQKQCLRTSELVCKRLGLKPDNYSSSFQSRIGPAQWIGPATQNELVRLAKLGKKRIAVSCPSFIADCLETVEEVNIELRETFLEAGGEAFHFLPCLNDSDFWVKNLAEEIKTRSAND
jgi:protoporphyrin/coproporphyrin ferrochelatase